jgi:uncharacterized repeat protein (TIGR01451 family)
MFNKLRVTADSLYRRNNGFRAARPVAAIAHPTQIEMLEGRLLFTISAAQVPFSVIEGTAYNDTVATFTDDTPSPVGNYSAVIDWGDTTASAGTISLNSGTYSVAGAHTYVEDGPYTVSISITESGGDSATPSGTSNVREAVLSATGSNFNAVEGQPFTGTTATFNDPGSSDPASEFTGSIDWGDGTTTAGTVTGSNGNYAVAGNHTYTSHGNFNVATTFYENNDPTFSITVGSTATVSEWLTISMTGPAQITEGGMLSYPISIHNPSTTDADNVVLTDTLPADASFSFAGFTQGGPFIASGQTVTGNLGTIAAGGTVNGSIVAQALEEGFFVNSAGVSFNSANITDENQSVFTTVIDAPLTPTSGKTISATKGKAFTGVLGSFTDADPNGEPADYSATIHWGDGTTSAGSIVPDGAGFDVVGTHTYAATGTNLALTVSVKDTGGSTATLNGLANVADAPPPSSGTVSIITDPCDSTKTAVKIIGTDNADVIVVDYAGAQGKAKVTINGVNKGTFNFTGTIQLYAQGGDDRVTVSSSITRSAWIWGGNGKDTVNAGSGNDFAFGNAGDDSMNGNNGRDILIGGDGTDKLNGGSGDDALIAGDFKSAPTMSQLCSVLKEWTRTDKSYSLRSSHLQSGGGYNTIKLNATTLFSSATLKDSLTGGSDNDLFFASVPGDVVTDKASSEKVVDIG